MSVRLGFGFGLVVFAVQIPPVARACEYDGQIDLDEFWPAHRTIDVPLDGVVLLRLAGAAVGVATLVVELDGAAVPGALEPTGWGDLRWRAAAPFAPNSIYSVTIGGDAPATKFAFTTGTELAAPPPAPVVTDLTLERFTRETYACIEEPGTCYCDQGELLAVEHRMHAVFMLPDPPPPFGTFTAVTFEIAPAPDGFPAELVETQSWPTAGGTALVDFGVAGTWPSDQVCARATATDPLDRRAVGPVVCTPIGDVNTIPPEPETDTGCSITTPTPALSALVLLVLFTRPRRRSTAIRSLPTPSRSDIGQPARPRPS